MLVSKRNGDIVNFNKQKIINAINAAFLDVDGQLYEDDTAKDIAEDIESYFQTHQSNGCSVEIIQDLIEEYLMRSERKDVAKSYIRYRYKKEVAREVKTDFFDAIGEKLEARNVQNQNANVDEHSFGGRIGEAAAVMTKAYALDNLVSKMARENHEGNMIYIHDLDNYAIGNHNCLTIPFDDLLAKGFNTRQTDVRPANSVNTAFQLIAVIFQLQSLQQFGGVSASHIDWTMVPYVRKSFFKHYVDGLKYVSHKKEVSIPAGVGDKTFELDNLPKTTLQKTAIDDIFIYNDEQAYQYAMDMTIREVYQAVEGMYHNLNTLQSRSGNQLN